jgi:hypothetical protein
MHILIGFNRICKFKNITIVLVWHIAYLAIHIFRFPQANIVEFQDLIREKRDYFI